MDFFEKNLLHLVPVSPALLLFLFVSALATSVISAVIGMSGGIILLGLMTLFLPLSVVIPLHGTTQLFSNGTRAFLLRSYIKKSFFIPFLLGIPPGIFLSLFLIKEFQNESVPLFLVACLIMYSLMRPKKLPPLRVEKAGFFFLGVVAAFMCLFIGAVGPFLAPFFLRDDVKKEEVISTKAAMQFLIHVVKIPSFIYLGFAYLDYWVPILILMGAAWLGTKWGIHLLKGIPQSLFEKLFKIFLFLAALRLYYKVFFAT